MFPPTNISRPTQGAIGGHLNGSGHLSGGARLPRSVPRAVVELRYPVRYAAEILENLVSIDDSVLRRAALPAACRAIHDLLRGRDMRVALYSARHPGGPAMGRSIMSPYVPYTERCKRREREQAATRMLREVNRKPKRPPAKRTLEPPPAGREILTLADLGKLRARGLVP